MVERDMGCPFCDIKNLNKRIFYCQEIDGEKHDRYFAFLDSLPHTRGHTILAVLSSSKRCPRQLNVTTLSRLGKALSDVIKVLRNHYPAKDILIASLRGDVKHVHIHLIPLWKNEENEWRKVAGYKKGHLMEFIGALEKRGNDRTLRSQANGVKEKEQRAKFERNPKTTKDIEELRKLARFEGMPNKQPKRNDYSHL